MPAKILVILVYYHGFEDTKLCLEALKESTVQADVVLVDNGSKKGEMEELKQSYAGLQVIQCLKNTGFGIANNIGIYWGLKQKRYDFFFILNNDAMVKPGTLETLMHCLDDPSIGAVIPLITFYHEPGLIWYAGGKMDWKRGGPVVPGFMQPLSSRDISSRFVNFASGCALMVRRDVLQKTGGFDQRYFMYEEDVDLSLRITKTWKIRYCAETMVLHKCQGSATDQSDQYKDPLSGKNKNLPFYAYHIFKNRLLNVHKHTNGLLFLYSTGFTILYFMVKYIKRMKGNRKEAGKALREAWKDYRKERDTVPVYMMNEMEYKKMVKN